MATQMQDYQKYDDFYQAFHQHRKQMSESSRIHLPQKSKARRAVPWRFVLLTLILVALLTVLVLTIKKQQDWPIFKVASLGQTTVPVQAPSPVLPSQEVELCQEFLCQLPKSPWSRTMVVVDVCLKTDSDSHQRLDEQSARLDRAVKDTIRATVASADLYQVNDPKLSYIRSELETRLGQVFEEDMTGRILIPRWKVRY